MLWNASFYKLLDFAMVGAPQDLKVSFVAPVCVETVADQPIRHFVFHSPSNNLDGVSTDHFTCDVLIYSRFVVIEVFVDSESCQNRSIFHDFQLNLLHYFGDSVKTSAVVFVGFECDFVIFVAAGLRALGHYQFNLFTVLASSIDWVLTWRNFVWLAACNCVFC